MDDLRLWGHTSAHRTFGPTAGFRINVFEGPLPFAEFQEAEPLGRGSGRKPRPSTRPNNSPAIPRLGLQPRYRLVEPAYHQEVRRWLA
jgi:hypothetical protein